MASHSQFSGQSPAQSSPQPHSAGPVLPAGSRLVIATHNAGKVREIGAMLAPLGFSCVSAGDLGLPEPEEDGATFAENALIKARAAAIASGLPSLADDSGLSVRALNGDPGIYSARWAGPEKDFGLAMRKVEEALAGHDDRAAAFHCALALSVPGQGEWVYEGRIDGDLVWPPRGDHGFGYDPVFMAEGMDVTFAEAGPAVKDAISHRARAFALFLAALQGNGKE